MKITLSAQQQATLFKWCSKITEGHLDDDCEPPGYSLEIHVGAALPTYAIARSGNDRIELGEVDLEITK